jgi:Sulfotransferase family
MPIDPDRLQQTAEHETGLSDWGNPRFGEALERLCRSASDEARLEGPTRIGFEHRIVAALKHRLELYGDRASFPEIAQQAIVAPMIVTGLPRSGTTILHALLAQDPEVRSPLHWELSAPSPPPRTETFDTDPRIATCTAALEALPTEFKAMHTIGATLPDECNSFMALAFLSPNFGAMANVPSYINWLIHEADIGPAYELHRHMLQHLQAFAPGSHWVLKAPPHLWWLGTMFDTYPDARVVVTHRDPAQVMASNASLIAYLRGQTFPVDPVALGNEQIGQWRTGIDRLLTFRSHDSRAAQMFDVCYADFVADQMAAVEAIYERFDMPLSAIARTAMARFLNDNGQGKHGGHSYSAATYGMSDDRLQTEFADYIAACLEAPEGDEQ